MWSAKRSRTSAPLSPTPKPLSGNNQLHLKDKIKRRSKSFARAVAIYAGVSSETGSLPNLAAASVGNPNEWRNPMPLIQVQVIKDVFSKEQKRQIISKLTDAMVSIEGENMRQVTFCLVEEVDSGDWGIGGKAMTTADVHALARGKAA